MQIKKLKRLFFILFFLIPNIAVSNEDMAGFTEAIIEVQDKFTELSAGKSEEAKIIDEAIKEINNATEFAKQAVASEDNENAINVLSFISKSLNDVSNLVPYGGALYESDMSKADMTILNEEQMADIQIITTAMKGKKEDDLNSIIQGMTELNKEGFNSFVISDKLNQLGVETIKVNVYLKDQEEMKGWTKEQWADSYKGSILTSTGTEVITGNEIETKVVELEKKLQKNNLVIAEKRSSLFQLESTINPLNSEIDQLKAQRDSLTTQYNSKLVIQAAKTLSDAEINESKTLADSFNKELTSLSGKINRIEAQSSKLQTQFADLNLQLASEVATSNQLSSQINLMNGQLSDNKKFISMKEVELDQLKESSPDIKANTDALNQGLQNVSLQRDFIQTQFERSIDKEVEHLKVYGRVLGDTEAEMEFSLREVGVILDSDPRRARAFELEKYGTFAGLSPDAIQNGITAIKNDDWGTQKEFYKEVITKLSKNPNWEVDVPSNAELNVMIAEEQALQNAVFAAIEGQKIKQKVDSIINSKIEEFNKNNELTKFSADVFKNHSERMFHKGSYSGWSTSITDEYKQVFENEVNSLLNGENKRIFEENQVQIERYNYAKAAGKYDTWSQAAWDDYRVFSTAESVNSNLITRVGEQAKLNLINKIEEVEKTIENIKTKEIAQADGYNYVDKVKEILGEVPTFSEDLQRIDQKNKWNNAFVDTPSIYDDPAALRAAMEGANDLEAYEAARDAMQKIGETPVSEYMTGPYWEMSNVKVAAIVRSKKYDYIDDYAYLNAYYDDPINLTSAERIEAEEELSRILSKDNPRLNALNKEIANLNNEIKNTNNQSININQDITKLENELQSLKTSENQLQNQITDLTKEFSSKEKLITQNKAKLTDFQKQLDPINSQIKGLETEKAELNIELEQHLNNLTDQIKNKGQATIETDQLKKQFESQIANIDDQLKQFEKESENIVGSVASINKELNSLEVETPKLSKQISSLNEDLKNFIDVKANMAIAQAQQYGLTVSDKVISSIGELDNKSIVTIDGSSVFKIVDTSTLTDNKGDFITPIGTLTVKGQVYSAGAVRPDLLFSIENIDTQRDLKVSFSQEAAKQIQKGGMLIGGKQEYIGSTLGSWVLVNALTGKQMTNALTGYNGSIVCTGAVCGAEGSFGKQAASFGGMYVLEGLADVKGNVVGRCADGDCQFDVETLRVLDIEGNVYNESGETIYKATFGTGTKEQIEIETYGITSGQRKNAVEYAVKNNIDFDPKNIPGVDADSLATQAKALASTNFTVTEINKQAGSYVKYSTKDFTKQIASTMTHDGEVFGISNTSEVEEIAQEVAQEVAKETAQVAQEVAEQVSKEVAQVAQEVAKEVAAVASSVITGNDIAALSELANDALGAWVLVDAATGKQMRDPTSGHLGSNVCKASVCGSEGRIGKNAAAFGGVYVLERLANPETGNAPSACNDGDCVFDLNN